jgi:hypothetical protein
VSKARPRRRRRDPPGPPRAQRPNRTSDHLAAERAIVAPPHRAAARGCLMVDGSLTRLRLSRLRAPRCHLWLADDERAALRPLWPPGLRQSLPAHAGPSGAADVGLATAGGAHGRGLGGSARLGLSWLAPGTALRAARRPDGRPSRAAGSRWRAAAGPARRPMRELQRSQGVESAAALAFTHRPPRG